MKDGELEKGSATDLDDDAPRVEGEKREGKRARSFVSECLLIVPIMACALALGFLAALFLEWCRYDSTRGYKIWEAATITLLVGGGVLFSLWWARRRAALAAGMMRVSLVRRVWALLFDLLGPAIAMGGVMLLELSRKARLETASLPFYACLVLLFLGRDSWGGAFSPGRRLLGYRIAGPDGKACSLPRSILRNLLPFGAPLLWMLYKLWEWGPTWCQSLEHLLEMHWETPISIVAYLALGLTLGLIDLGLIGTRSDGRRSGDLIAGTRAVPRDGLSA